MSAVSLEPRATIRALGFLASRVLRGDRCREALDELRKHVEREAAMVAFIEGVRERVPEIPDWEVSAVVRRALGKLSPSAILGGFAESELSLTTLSFLDRLSADCVDYLTAARFADSTHPDAT